MADGQLAGSPWTPDAVAICVPVRDEAALLPFLLDALAEQTGLDGLDISVCFLLDGCVDESAAVIARFAKDSRFPIHVEHGARAPEPNAGLARRRAMAMGQAALAGEARVAVLTTDADSRPARDWVCANLAALTRADVVAGRIERLVEGPGGRADAVQARVEAYYDRLFALRRALDPVPWEADRMHHYTSGASMAFRGDAYHAIGGFPPIASGEDAAIIDAAHLAGLRVRRDADVLVRTSARSDGRASTGLASHLRDLRAGGSMPTMAHPADAAWRWVRHAAARAAWLSAGTGATSERLAALLGVTPGQLRAALAVSANAEAFATRTVPAVPGGERTVTLDEAEPALRAAERSTLSRAA